MTAYDLEADITTRQKENAILRDLNLPVPGHIDLVRLLGNHVEAGIKLFKRITLPLDEQDQPLDGGLIPEQKPVRWNNVDTVLQWFDGRELSQEALAELYHLADEVGIAQLHALTRDTVFIGYTRIEIVSLLLPLRAVWRLVVPSPA